MPRFFFYNSSEGLNVKYKIYLTCLSILWMKLRFRMDCKIPVLCQVLLLYNYLAELWKLTFTTVIYYFFCSRLLIISSYGFKRLSSVPRYYEIRKLRLVVTSDWIGVVIVIRSVERYDLMKTAFLCGLWLRRLCCSETRLSKSQGEAEELNRLQRVQKWFWFFFSLLLPMPTKEFSLGCKRYCGNRWQKKSTIWS